MWLLNEEVARHISAMRRSGVVPTAEQMAALERSAAEARDGAPRNMVMAGDDVAEIRVQGVLTMAPDFWARFCGVGNTTYPDIITALALAKADQSVSSVVLYVDSPGGNVGGLFDCLAAIEDFRVSSGKPMSVRAANAQSAAYAIAAAAGNIEATNAAATFGSIGVAVSYFVDDTIVDITNTASPAKRPDVTTKEGKAVVQAGLDALHELFTDAIARGRGNGVTAAKVTKDYGRGATLLAGEAKARGMVDSIAKPALRALPSAPVEGPEDVNDDDGEASATPAKPRAQATASKQTNVASAVSGAGRIKRMTKEELKAQHPELYAAIVADSTAQERDRVVAHLMAGEMSGDIKTASECIRSGALMTMTLQTQYMLAAANRSSVGARQADSDAAGAVLAGAKKPAEQVAAPDLADEMIKLLQEGGL